MRRRNHVERSFEFEEFDEQCALAFFRLFGGGSVNLLTKRHGDRVFASCPSESASTRRSSSFVLSGRCDFDGVDVLVVDLKR